MQSRGWRCSIDSVLMATLARDAPATPLALVAEGRRGALTVASEADVVQVRQILREYAVEAGLGLVDQTKLVTAGSELARNILTHASGGQGELGVAQVRTGDRTGVRATFSDEGPGIADLDAAMSDGYSTVGSLGLGLPGCRRLVDEFTITSAEGSGTTVVIAKWRR
jgi:serine/threonine-protein kinase RsbT